MSTYVIDTNELRVWLNYYMHESVPPFDYFWNEVERFLKEGKIIFVREEYGEIIKQVQGEAQLKWLENHKSYFVPPTNEETQFISKMFLNKKFQESVGQKSILDNRKAADPFIIAKGYVLGEDGIVVTREKPKNNSAKIPTICSYYNIKCQNGEELIKLLFPH